jgi:hypothetical protein
VTVGSNPRFNFAGQGPLQETGEVKTHETDWHTVVFDTVFVFFGAVPAQEGPKTLPGDPLYQAKRQTETAKLNASFDPLERATLHTRSAEERLAEVKAMVSKGKPQFVGDLLKSYETSMNGAMDEIDRAQAQKKD